MSDLQYGTIRKWPGTLRGERVKAPFKSDRAETFRLLERELRLVRAEAAVIQLAMEHFNRDGRPYADATPEHPGVLVSFVKPIASAAAVGPVIKRVPLRFAADRFTTWTDNLRAVAIGLEDLRRIDRYGITTGSEQYLGFKALPPPGPEHAAILTVDDAARFLAAVSSVDPFGKLLSDPAMYRGAYRLVAAKLHPDAGGDADNWARLQAAKSLLDRHHMRGATA